MFETSPYLSSLDVDTIRSPRVAFILVIVVSAIVIIMGNAIFFGGPSGATYSSDKKRLRDSSRKQRPEEEHENDDEEPNRWIQDYDVRRKRVYYWNPALQEISWKLPPKDSQGPASRTTKPALGRLLPPNSEWQVAYDRTNQRPYFYNPQTQAVRWVLGDNEDRSSSLLSSDPPGGESQTHVIVEHKGKRGLVQVPALTSSFSTVRRQLFVQLEEDMHPPKDIPEQQHERQEEDWVFQLASNHVLISKVQEKDVPLFQTLLKQHDPLIVKVHVRDNDAISGNTGPDEVDPATKKSRSTNAAGEDDTSINGWETVDTDYLATTTGTLAADADATNPASSIPAASADVLDENASPATSTATTAALTSAAPILNHISLNKSTASSLPSPTPQTTTPKVGPTFTPTPNLTVIAPGTTNSATTNRPTSLLSVPPVEHHNDAEATTNKQGNPPPTTGPPLQITTTITGTTAPRPPPPPPLPPMAQMKPRKPPTPPPPTRRSTRKTTVGTSSSNGSHHSIAATAGEAPIQPMG
jgi:hypothetical protein